MNDDDIKFTLGEDDPVFNGIYIITGCNCDGYSCKDIQHNCDRKKHELKNSIISNQESIKAIREYLDIMKDEPDAYIKLSKVYNDLRRMIGDE